MKKISKSLIFFGTEDFSAASLQALLSNSFDIQAVITKPDSKKGRGYREVAPLVKKIAEQHNIPVWQPLQVKDIEDKISKISNPIGVLVSYGKIIPKSTLKLFSSGIINVHPSLLPRYRGPSPIESAILNGDKKTGVSIMRLSDKMDAGPIYTQKEFILNGKEIKPELYDKLSHLGAGLLVSCLDKILSQAIEAEPQNDQLATYCQLLSPEQGWLKPESMTAVECERHIRAYLGFPRSKLYINSHRCIITRASVIDKANELPLVIECRNNTLLSIEKLIAPSGKTLDATSFLRGYS